MMKLLSTVTLAILALTAAGAPSVAFGATSQRAPDAQPATQAAAPARILFLGLWDRAFEQMSRASAETGVSVRIKGIVHAETPGAIAAEMGELRFEQYDLVYVLQIDQMQAHALVDVLRRAKAAKPDLRVVQLDRRGSQQELIDEGLLEIDPQVRAYWRGFGMENLKRLLTYSRVKYLGEPGEIAEPVPAAAAGLYHPDAVSLFASWPDYAAWYAKRPGYRADRPLVAVFIQQDYIIYGNSQVYEALIRELEKRGINVAPMFGAMADLQRLVRECRPSLLLLQHHSGPEDAPGPDGTPFLEELGAPYLYSAGMMSGITVKEWRDDVRGIKMGGYGQLARHEFYGIIEPFLIGARGSSAYGFALDEPIPERVERLADRVQGWLRLQSTSVQDKKVAIIYFHKYLGKADIARPAPEMSHYFDPHASLLELLRAMSKAGYRVGPLPESTEALLELLKKSGRNIPSWAPGELHDLLANGDPILLSEADYVRWYTQKLSTTARAIVEKSHGPPPGEFMVTERGPTRYIVLPCIRLGNVVIGPQPDRGSIQDRDLVHSRTVPPPHNYLAFYFWLQEQFGAHALVHFGTHGSDFYLPGKEIFLSGDCFPDVIVGDMPNFYVWTIQNIGEAVIAKRRSYSVIVDHGVPPILAASRDAQADDLLELIDRFQAATAPAMKESIRRQLADGLRESPFLPEVRISLKPDELPTEAQVETISHYLRHVTTNNEIEGMHVLGVPPAPERALPFVVHIVARNTDLLKKLAQAAGDGDVQARAHQLLTELLINKASPADAAAAAGVSEAFVVQDLEEEILLARHAWDSLERTGDEITNLLAGLEGKYVPPGPGGDPIQRPDALPTGRNLYSLSPHEIPTRPAWDLACRMTDEFLAKFHAEHGRYPERLAFTMTGMETFRNMGVMEAQILYLLGIRPEWSPGKLLSGLRVIPRHQLGRPRVDVIMSVNGIYLKDFAPCVRVLDEAVRMAVACDEPDNPIRRHSRNIEAELRASGVNEDRASLLSQTRILGSEAGGAGARLVWFLPRSGTWQDRTEVLELWRAMRTHAYAGELWGEKLPELHDKVYAGTEGVITNWSDNLLGPLTNHHYPEETGGLAMSIQALTGKRPDISVFDLRQRDRATAIGLEDVLSLELRATAFNRDWIVGQMKHGYAGATQFMQLADNSFQWEAVREGAIWPGAWDRMVDVYVRDSLKLNIREFFDRHNPFAFQELTATLLETARKGYWVADSETVRELAIAHADSVARFGHGAGPYAGGNQKLHTMLATTLSRPGDEQLRKSYLEKVDLAEKARADIEAEDSPVAQHIAGQKMESTVDAPILDSRPTVRKWSLYLAAGAVMLGLILVGYRFRVGGPPAA
ncbi:MAG TPA: cobaltochelatase subunit CobN [Phycisphaerae bacterium]|nr:cobaltochelatase subunit CobN [Phycisphaerae bacterium]HOM49950.1 cobaltochelatase subunit CobN [Phycisphaerae bacterium]HOQ84577.1 cobaltochelatase subunit CobN [Phycisphaerae bacterium]